MQRSEMHPARAPVREMRPHRRRLPKWPARRHHPDPADRVQLRQGGDFDEPVVVRVVVVTAGHAHTLRSGIVAAGNARLLRWRTASGEPVRDPGHDKTDDRPESDQKTQSEQARSQRNQHPPRGSPPRPRGRRRRLRSRRPRPRGCRPDARGRRPGSRGCLPGRRSRRRGPHNHRPWPGGCRPRARGQSNHTHGFRPSRPHPDGSPVSAARPGSHRPELDPQGERSLARRLHPGHFQREVPAAIEVPDQVHFMSRAASGVGNDETRRPEIPGACIGKVHLLRFQQDAAIKRSRLPGSVSSAFARLSATAASCARRFSSAVASGPSLSGWTCQVRLRCASRI